MQRDLKRLAGDTFDVLVIGGGVHGVAAAWDLVLRGFSVALIEKGDIGGGTSANSLKIIHGGLRYLQHLDIRRMRESIRERSALMRILPHLIRPLPFLVPAYGHGARGRMAMAVACRINDWVGHGRNRHLDGLGRAIPDGRPWSKEECLDAIPGLPARGLTGGVVFYDGQMENADRVTLSFALSAASKGACIGTYVEAVGFIREAGRVAGVKAVDVEGGAEFEIRARWVVNMAGPWAPFLVRDLYPEAKRGEVPLSKGFQIVTRDLTGLIGLAVTSPHRDPDAVLSRGGRHYFIAPWRGHSLIGNTDSEFRGSPDGFRIEADEIAAFVEEVAAAFPGAGLTTADVVHAFGGVQPANARRLGTGAQVAKHPIFVDHRRDLKLSGLLTVIGVKYTACRWVAEKTADRVCKGLGYRRAPCRTATTPLLGGDLRNIDEFLRRMRESAVHGLSGEVLERLGLLYGTQAPRLVRMMDKEPALARLVPGSREVVPMAAVAYAVRHEGAIHLDDVVMRRTELGTLGDPGEAAVQACAEWMAGELGWGEGRGRLEVGRLLRYWPVGGGE